MQTRKLIFLSVIAIGVLLTATIAHADCSASQNCALCNSGNFTPQCQCHDSSSFICTGCWPPNPCAGGVGCCCGHTTTNPPVEECGSFSCGGGSGEQCLSKVDRPSDSLIASISPVAAAAAFRLLAKDAGPRILDLEPRVEIENDPGSVVEISDFKLDISSEKISGATYTLRNTSGQALIAFNTSIDFYWDQSSKPCTGGNSQDAWFLNGTILQPGKSETVHFYETITPNSPTHIFRVVVSLQYANFADGTTTGRSAAVIAKKINQTRREKLAVQKEFAQALRSGMTDQAFLAKLKADLASASPKNRARRTALIEMQIAVKAAGPEAVVPEILEPPTVQLP